MSKSVALAPRLQTFRKFFAVFALGLLAIPLVAMQFTDEVEWGIGDFALFAALLL